jgi:hypothetical protein
VIFTTGHEDNILARLNQVNHFVDVRMMKASDGDS